jgi:hypothetical protein
MLTSVRLPRAALLASLTMLSALLLFAGASPASAAERTWSASQTIPVPPASHFAGSGGGDGWSIALSTDAVYNVFHHGTELTVNCHIQTDSSECWSSPKTITDASGHGFATSGHSGLYLDQNSGKLYVYATQTADAIGGVVCIDTTQPASNPNPFCGFTALTPAGGAVMLDGWGALSAPMQVGDRLYSFNYVPQFGVSGAKNAVLCFDLETDAACAGQPFAVDIGASTVANRTPSPSTAAIGDVLMIPVATNAGLDALVCFDPATQDDCAGNWPVQTGVSSAGNDGGPFPLMSANGTTTGVCLPTGADPCFTLDGATTPTPDAMPSVINNSEPWNGPSVVIGPRVYVPTGSGDRVQCFDYSTGASCPNFPMTFSGLGYLYTVNPDPQRSDCLWVNADGGAAQIQNFDAYTGQPCGQGPLRVLASTSVIAQPQCTPTGYVSLQVTSPARDTYDSGSVTFIDGTGNPIPGAADRPVDSTGTVDLTGLDLNTPTGLPQFLITLTGQTGDSSSITLTLTWTGEDSANCTPPVDPPLAEISLPASGARYALDESASTSFACTDGEGGPGIETCVDSNGVSGSADTGSGSTGTGALDTSAYGAYTYSVQATSLNGQSRTASVQYSVAHPQTVSFPSTSVQYGAADFSPASASSELPATYSDPSGACTVSAGGTRVHLVGAGSCTVTADQAGNADYFAAPSVTQTFEITKGPQTISFPARSVSMTHADYSPASASSGLAVDYSDASGECTIDGEGLVNVTGEGSCTVTAGQAGNDDYFSATPVTQTFTVLSGPHVELANAGCVSFQRNGYLTPFTASVIGVDDQYYNIFAEPASSASPWDDPYAYGSGFGDGDAGLYANARANPAPTTVWLAVWTDNDTTLLVETEVPVCAPSAESTTVAVVGGCVPVADGAVQPYYADLTNVDDNVFVFTEASPTLPEDLNTMYLYGQGTVGAAGTIYVQDPYNNTGVESSTVWVTVRPSSDYFSTIYAQAEVPVCSPPTSDAGDDVAGSEGSAVALDGTITDEMDAASAHWTIDDAACTFADASATDTTVTCTDDGEYTATLTADDGDYSPVQDTAMVTISNVAPTVTLSSENPLTPYATMTERTFNYSISDPGDDTVSAVTTSCGSSGSKVPGSDTNTNTSGSFRCVFDTAPASSTVSASATDSDDDTGDADTQTVTVIGHAPVASDDTATVEEDAGATNVDVLTNDTDVETELIQITAVGDPENGTATVVDGTPDEIAYTPGANYCGADSFTYTVNGGDTATVEVTVTCVDDDPNAAADSATVDTDSAATAVMVLANDTDRDGGTKQVASVTQPANGTVVIADDGRSVTYKPRTDYCNTQTGGARDTFTYTLNGGDTATVAITVTCPAATPVPTVTPPAPLPLRCSGRSIVVLDVHRAGTRVVIAGVAKTSLAGQTVVIREVATSHQLATARVERDGTFAASVALPSPSKIATIRYRASIGRKSSAELRLTRRLTILSTTATATGARITGRLSGVTSARTITISRQVSCEKFTTVGTIRTSRTGRFSVDLPAPAAAVGVAFYRASNRVGNGETFSLPIALRSQAR